MHAIRFAATLLVPLALIAQDVKHPLLSSHDRVEGPLGGEYRIEDVRVFADGRVICLEERTKTLGEKPERLTFETRIGLNEVQGFADLLNSPEVRSLPKKIPSKTRPIDFFWQKSLQINRGDRTQEIQIDNFYPFVNQRHPVYPKELIELECRLQDIKLEAANRPRPPDEDDWCSSILAKGDPPKADCQDDSTRPKIVAAEGWGPVRVGSDLEAVDDSLGKGRVEHRYSDVYLKDYLAKGVQVSYDNATNKVHAIFFYNGQRDSEEFGVFCGQTDRGINWQSTAEQVKKAYGKPTGDYSGGPKGTWERLVFAGIDFRFENRKLVRIGIPGN